MLKMTRTVYEDIIAHARKEAPLEACGYLAATASGLVCRYYELTNMDAAEDHYTMIPAEQFAAVKNMRQQGLTMAAVYHSHPCSPARPSVEDIRLAYDPAVSYVIVSLLNESPEVKTFRIDNGVVAPEPLEIQDMEDIMNPVLKTDALKDLRGVGCPMNLVKTKVALSGMQSGQLLELILDNGAPIRNVPEAARREGHEVLCEEQLEDGAWTVVIRKG
jgi:[CysO sulfur-carrier protein]-S-L-cysteine hydrolase